MREQVQLIPTPVIWVPRPVAPSPEEFLGAMADAPEADWDYMIWDNIFPLEDSLAAVATAPVAAYGEPIVYQSVTESLSAKAGDPVAAWDSDFVNQAQTDTISAKSADPVAAWLYAWVTQTPSESITALSADPVANYGS